MPLDAITALFANSDQILDAQLEHSARLIFSMHSQHSLEMIDCELKYSGKSLPHDPDFSFHDRAMHCWNHEPAVLERAYGRDTLLLKRSFTYYPPAPGRTSVLTIPTEDTVREFSISLQKELKAACGAGHGLWIVPYIQQDKLIFLIRYAERMKRRGCVAGNGASRTISYRPEEFRFVVYDCRQGDLRVFAPE